MSVHPKSRYAQKESIKTPFRIRGMQPFRSAGASVLKIDPALFAKGGSHCGRCNARAVGRSEADLPHEVERLSGEALHAGLAGVVCSPQEVALVRPVVGSEAWIVVPGIRGRGDARGDQVRVATAAEAVAAGATHLVVGRPILQAADPSAAFRGLLEEAQCIGS